VGASPVIGGAAGADTLEPPTLEPLAGPTEATTPSEADQVELVGRPFSTGIRDWLASIGESWSQTTFYLFDPESWR
jgi:hypothetical protein